MRAEAQLSLRTEAEAIANVLETGLLGVADAVTWADRQIAAADVPDVALCDVSMASRKYPQDVASMLRSIPGDVDHDAAMRETMRIVLGILQTGVRDPRDVARALFNFAVTDNLPDGELKHGAFSFWDDIDLARDGIYARASESETVAHMKRVLNEFVNQNAR